MLAAEGSEENEHSLTLTVKLSSEDKITTPEPHMIQNVKIEAALKSDTSVEASDGASESEVEAVVALPKRRTRCGIKLGESVEVFYD